MVPRIAVVIVSFNVVTLLRDCLHSLQGTEGAEVITWVVDNDSSDGSADMVAAEFPQVRLIANNDNTGFAFACNQALREIAALQSVAPATLQPGGTATAERPAFDYVLLLNPDTQVPPHALSHLVRFLEDHPDAAVVGPKLIRKDGSIDLACRRSFPTPEVSLYRQLGLSRLFPRSRRFGRYNLTYLDPDQTYEVDAVVGAFMLIRWKAIEQVGLLDESFWMYGEDLDWMLRMKQAGWKVYYCPEVVVLHYKGESSRRHSSRATREFYRAMLLFYRKHYAATTNPLIGALVVSGIHLKGAWSSLRNALRPVDRRRVS
jgi:GT2 family glycosyltransferase